jgi:hypothetical protein
MCSNFGPKLPIIHLAKEKVDIKCILENLPKRSWEQRNHNQLQRKEIDLQTQYQSVLRNEEETWRLKSHSLWLKVGDKNTKLFHNQAKAR